MGSLPKDHPTRRPDYSFEQCVEKLRNKGILDDSFEEWRNEGLEHREKKLKDGLERFLDLLRKEVAEPGDERPNIPEVADRQLEKL
jgi:hypothetical protein